MYHQPRIAQWPVAYSDGRRQRARYSAITKEAMAISMRHVRSNQVRVPTQSGGVMVHSVRSPYQAGVTDITVSIPDDTDRRKRYPVVYVLPVEKRNENVYGDAMAHIAAQRLYLRHRAIFVMPTFSHLPWYADHPRDRRLRQESHLLRFVLPFIERQYPVRAGASGRFLLGFSKSGWGAFALLLRHPDLFAKAAAWDAPLMKDKPNEFRMRPIFGTQANFDNYRVAGLLEKRAAGFRKGKRLILLGYGNFRQHHRQAHELMLKFGIDHHYRDGPKRKHIWESGWVSEALEMLLGP
jgi:enterochelin esterase-like enzyme